MNKILEVNSLSKNYQTINGEVIAIDNITFSLDNQEFLCIVGSSGCGKSTLLNILAGIDSKTKGDIKIKDGLKIGYMLQEDALFPWLNILDNACLGLDIAHKKTKENISFVKDLLNKYGLKDFLDKYPYELSGGMRQRVALIRTLALKPDILMLDEPFSALDYVSRLKVSEDVSKIIKQEKKSVIMITHDIAEAISLADRVIVLSKRPGKVKNIYDIDLKHLNSPLERRNSKDFSYYYDLLWKEIDKDV